MLHITGRTHFFIEINYRKTGFKKQLQEELVRMNLSKFKETEF